MLTQVFDNPEVERFIDLCNMTLILCENKINWNICNNAEYIDRFLHNGEDDPDFRTAGHSRSRRHSC